MARGSGAVRELIRSVSLANVFCGVLRCFAVCGVLWVLCGCFVVFCECFLKNSVLRCFADVLQRFGRVLVFCECFL